MSLGRQYVTAAEAGRAQGRQVGAAAGRCSTAAPVLLLCLLASKYHLRMLATMTSGLLFLAGCIAKLVDTFHAYQHVHAT